MMRSGASVMRRPPGMFFSYHADAAGVRHVEVDVIVREGLGLRARRAGHEKPEDRESKEISKDVLHGRLLYAEPE